MYFSGMDFPLPEARYAQLEEFEAAIRDVCGAFSIKSHQNASQVLSHVSIREFAALDIACIGHDVAEVQRTQKEIREDAGDYYFMIVQHEGRVGISQNDQECWLDPGDMAIVDAARPSRFCFDGGYSGQISVHLPRAEMDQRFGRRISGGIQIPKEDMLGVAMRSILAKLMADPDKAEQHVREAFFGVLGAFLTERHLGERPINPNRLIISRAISLMSEHFRDPAFTTAVLADLLGISLRRLQRAFHTIDETPHIRLQRIRIEHAHRAIMRTPIGQGAASISTIAFSSGFGDLSTFYRSFKSRYGTSPKKHAGRLLQ
ncbi:helix-turn-helix domain-containing protein [Roseobacter sp. MH60115]|uniref:helix-turn-helix domain-containing protein n=1 Tax=Roseobacter sp. MH60115 TaxID=2785324 RepID=UPI0018A3079A|nr:helix-turn-helix domain-containing protein [Roseobacter sp. MH60115]